MIFNHISGILEERLIMKVLKYKGSLETYYETGMEHLGLQLYRDGYEVPNKHYDPKDPSKGPKYFHDWSGVISLDPGDKITILKSQLKQYEGKSFTIGNRSWAKEDNYRFGACYPSSKIPILDWRNLFELKTKAIVEKKIKKIALYGGTFDPIHEGHKDIIDNLRYKYDLVLILPGNNWTKSNHTMFPLEQRINAVKSVCEKLSNVKVLTWAQKQNTSSTYKMVQKVAKEYGVVPSVVIGADNVDKIESWKFWDELKKLNFVIFPRSGSPNPDLSKFEIPPTYWGYLQPSNKEMSSTKIRLSGDYSCVPKVALPYLDLSLLPQKETDMIKK